MVFLPVDTSSDVTILPAAEALPRYAEGGAEGCAARLEEMMEETFEGSMPAFIAAFSKSKRLSKDEVEQLRQLIDSYEE